MEKELAIRERLLSAGIVEQLKEMDIFIWAIRVGKREETYHADFSVDVTLNPGVDIEKVKALIQYVVEDLGVFVNLQLLPIKTFCCYGRCHGCLNGDPDAQPVWIGRKF